MMNRIHFKNHIAAERVAKYLISRGNKVNQLSSGCIFESGKILEMGDSTFDNCCQLVDAFEIEVKIEM